MARRKGRWFGQLVTLAILGGAGFAAWKIGWVQLLWDKVKANPWFPAESGTGQGESDTPGATPPTTGGTSPIDRALPGFPRDGPSGPIEQPSPTPPGNDPNDPGAPIAPGNLSQYQQIKATVAEFLAQNDWKAAGIDPRSDIQLADGILRPLQMWALDRLGIGAGKWDEIYSSTTVEGRPLASLNYRSPYSMDAKTAVLIEKLIPETTKYFDQQHTDSQGQLAQQAIESQTRWSWDHNTDIQARWGTFEAYLSHVKGFEANWQNQAPTNKDAWTSIYDGTSTSRGFRITSEGALVWEPGRPVQALTKEEFAVWRTTQPKIDAEFKRLGDEYKRANGVSMIPDNVAQQLRKQAVTTVTGNVGGNPASASPQVIYAANQAKPLPSTTIQVPGGGTILFGGTVSSGNTRTASSSGASNTRAISSGTLVNAPISPSLSNVIINKNPSAGKIGIYSSVK